MEPIGITVRYDEQGRFTPLKFTWQTTTFSVESTGRHWEDDQGKHVLVMVIGGQVYELLFATQEARWYLKPIVSSRSMA